MITLYFKITNQDNINYFHSEYDDNYIKWKQERIFADFRYGMQKDPTTLKKELKSYNERELSIFGIFLFADRLLKITDDKDALEKMSLLACRVYEVLDSIDNTHGFNIDLDDSNISEMDFDEVTQAMMIIVAVRFRYKLLK